MLALGHYMVELPGFSEKFSKEFRYYLEWAETSFVKALEVAAKEGVAQEFAFSVIDAQREMAETCFLLAEYRERTLNYKYADFSARDAVRRLERFKDKKRMEKEDQGQDDLGAIGDDGADNALKEELEAQGDKWEENKANKEDLSVFNYRNKSTRYLEAAVGTATSRMQFRDF